MSLAAKHLSSGTAIQFIWYVKHIPFWQCPQRLSEQNSYIFTVSPPQFFIVLLYSHDSACYVVNGDELEDNLGKQWVQALCHHKGICLGSNDKLPSFYEILIAEF
jgi:hypothetical protein